MARRVLILASIAFVATAGEPAPRRTCPPTIGNTDVALSQQYLEFKQSIESGPLIQHLGRSVSCSARVDAGAIWLTYSYAKGGKLEAHHDAALELTEQRLTTTGLSKQAALTLLQRTERWAFEPKGCNIIWNRPPAKEAGSTPESSELVYRGDTCNCQGRLVYARGRLAGLIFRSAC